MWQLMRRVIVAVLATLVVVSVADAKGEAVTASAPGGVDNIAVLLVEQGVKLYEAHHLDAARASLDLAIQVNPLLSVAYLNAATVASAMGDKKEALLYLERFLDREPGHPDGERLLASLKAGYYSGPLVVGGGGFSEFGLAALIGSLFPFAMVIYSSRGLSRR